MIAFLKKTAAQGLKPILVAMGFLLIFTTPAESAPSVPVALTYADLADLALPAPVAAHVRIVRAVKLKTAAAPDVPPGKTRFYVEADLLSLIKGPEGMPARVSYLVDLPNRPEGRPPKFAKKSEYVLLASTVPGRPGELRLTAPDAHLPWTADQAQRIRQILKDAAQPDGAPGISGIGRAFHVPGSLPGESETQIFLQAADGRPLSLNILRRPGEEPRWAVALSEVVDDAAQPPHRDTLLWYRLACSLPGALPGQSFAEGDALQAQAIRADYQLVLEGLGPCIRSRKN